MAVLLTKTERIVMQAVYDLASAKGTVMVRLDEIMQHIPTVRAKKSKAAPGVYTAAGVGAELSPESDTAATLDAAVVQELDTLLQKKDLRTKKKKSKSAAKDDLLSKKAYVERIYVDLPPVKKGLFFYGKPLTYDKLKQVIKRLSLEEYYELTEAVSDGELVYVFQLSKKGYRFEWEEKDRKKRIAIRIGLLIGTPVVSFIVTMILRSIFFT